MKTVNIEELTRKINEFIQKNQGKSFTGTELLEVLGELGFNKNVAYKIARSAFPFEKMGISILYEVPKKPIYVELIKTMYKNVADEQRKRNHRKKVNIGEEITEKTALDFLNSRGYQIRKCIGFDLDRFAKENPVLYKKYLKYEIV
jgi:hypothetical protein